MQHEYHVGTKAPSEFKDRSYCTTGGGLRLFLLLVLYLVDKPYRVDIFLSHQSRRDETRSGNGRWRLFLVRFFYFHEESQSPVQ